MYASMSNSLLASPVLTDWDDEDEPDECGEGCSAPCLFLLALPSAVLLFLGSRVLHGAVQETGSERAAVLTELRSAVATWEQRRPSLTALRFQLNWSTPGHTEAFELEASSSMENERLKQGADVPTWTPLRFQASLPVRAWKHPFGGALSVGCIGPAGQSRFAIDGIDFTQMHQTRSSNWKECVHQRKGAYHGGNCTVARVVSSLCFAFDVDGEGRVAPHGMGTPAFGCRLSGGRWHSITHRTVPSARQRGAAPSQPSVAALSAGVKVTVRSALDPHLVVMNLTGGSMRVDATAQEQLRLSAVLLTLGACLGLPPLVAFCASVLAARKRGRGEELSGAGLQHRKTGRSLPPRQANVIV